MGGLLDGGYAPHGRVMVRTVGIGEDVAMAKILDLRVRQLVAGAVLMFGAACAAYGQDSATLRGRVVDAAGHPLRSAVVRLITDQTSSATSRTWRYKFVVDEFGNYSESGIAPGNYIALLFVDGKGLEVAENVVLKSGDANLVNFELANKGHGKIR
jgi:hypothetical protein